MEPCQGISFWDANTLDNTNCVVFPVLVNRIICQDKSDLIEIHSFLFNYHKYKPLGFPCLSPQDFQKKPFFQWPVQLFNF